MTQDIGLNVHRTMTQDTGHRTKCTQNNDTGHRTQNPYPDVHKTKLKTLNTLKTYNVIEQKTGNRTHD